MVTYIYTVIISFTEINPDKGTETVICHADVYFRVKFTEINPDKGTETRLFVLPYAKYR